MKRQVKIDNAREIYARRRLKAIARAGMPGPNPGIKLWMTRPVT